MTQHCDFCGHANPVSESTCRKCGQKLFTPADQRAGRYVLAAVLLLILLLAVLLLAPADSQKLREARGAIFGKALASRLGGVAGENNAREAASGSIIPDAQATNNETGIDASIGRLPRQPGPRKDGDDVRAGAGGTDDPAERIGNSQSGEITDAPSAGGNRGNASRNSVETPDGNELQTGPGSGVNPLENASTNVPQREALLIDDFSERLRQAGARSGDVQISLEWQNVNDLDLHVVDPRGEEIFFNHRQSASGGNLDVDMNAAYITSRPVENVYWPLRGAPRGTYRVDVVHFANHGAVDPTVFTIRVLNKGKVTHYRGQIIYRPTNVRARVTVCSFTVY